MPSGNHSQRRAPCTVHNFMTMPVRNQEHLNFLHEINFCFIFRNVSIVCLLLNNGMDTFFFPKNDRKAASDETDGPVTTESCKQCGEMDNLFFKLYLESTGYESFSSGPKENIPANKTPRCIFGWKILKFKILNYVLQLLECQNEPISSEIQHCYPAWSHEYKREGAQIYY